MVIAFSINGLSANWGERVIIQNGTTPIEHYIKVIRPIVQSYLLEGGVQRFGASDLLISVNGGDGERMESLVGEVWRRRRGGDDPSNPDALESGYLHLSEVTQQILRFSTHFNVSLDLRSLYNHSIEYYRASKEGQFDTPEMLQLKAVDEDMYNVQKRTYLDSLCPLIPYEYLSVGFEAIDWNDHELNQMLQKDINIMQNASLFIQLFFTCIKPLLDEDVRKHVKLVYAAYRSDDSERQSYLARFIDSVMSNNATSLNRIANETQNANSNPSNTTNTNNNSKMGRSTDFVLCPKNPVARRDLHTLQSTDCNRLISLRGVVTRCSEVRPELVCATFLCDFCGASVVCEQRYRYTKPIICSMSECNNRTKFSLDISNPNNVFTDWQKVRIQSSSLRIPRTIEGILRHEAVNSVKCGDKVDFVGMLVAMPVVDSMGSVGKDSGRKELVGAESNGTSAPIQKKAQVDTHVPGVSGVLGVREMMYRNAFMVFSSEIEASTDSDIDDSLSASIRLFVSDLIRKYDELENRRMERARNTTTTAGDAAGDEDVVEAENENEDSNTSPRGAPKKSNGSEAGITDCVDIRILPDLGIVVPPLMANLGVTSAKLCSFISIATHYNYLRILSQSICPWVTYHPYKKGILALIAGGVNKTTEDGIKLRGTLNVMLLGDPGTAKSSVLNWVARVFDTVMTSGKSTSAAGLTASIHRDKESGTAAIDPGALILADQGICCIDEFNLIDPADMVAIHEAMEQQTISISKAGVQATMNSRASVLAASSPVGGYYDTARSVRENVVMGPTILSRFDLIYVILDDKSEDENIAQIKLFGSKFKILRASTEVVDEEDNEEAINNDVEEVSYPILDEESLKLYVKLAQLYQPSFSQGAKKIILDNYIQLRQRRSKGNNITTRQLESQLRLSEAVAKLNFSHTITKEHAEQAVQIFNAAQLNTKSRLIPLKPWSGFTPLQSTTSDTQHNPTEIIESIQMGLGFDVVGDYFDGIEGENGDGAEGDVPNGGVGEKEERVEREEKDVDKNTNNNTINIESDLLSLIETQIINNISLIFDDIDILVSQANLSMFGEEEEVKVLDLLTRLTVPQLCTWFSVRGGGNEEVCARVLGYLVEEGRVERGIYESQYVSESKKIEFVSLPGRSDFVNATVVPCQTVDSMFDFGF